jgi:hypothetical protein
MRAYDVVAAGSDKPKFEQLAQTSDRIAELRKDIWDAEYGANGLNMPSERDPEGPLPPGGAAQIERWVPYVRQKKRTLAEVLLARALLAPRRGHTPDDWREWLHGWERHSPSFEFISPTPWMPIRKPQWVWIFRANRNRESQPFPRADGSVWRG